MVKPRFHRDLLYGITRLALFPDLDVDRYLRLAFYSTCQVIQWRDKERSSEENRYPVRLGVRISASRKKLFIVNSFVELALEEGAAGAHLTEGQSVTEARDRVTKSGRDDFLLGQSVHTLAKAAQAERDGADYVILGPIFPPISKESDTPPLGTSGLREVTQALHIPVLGIGGISEANLQNVFRTGAIGAAGITLLAEQIQTG